MNVPLFDLPNNTFISVCEVFRNYLRPFSCLSYSPSGLFLPEAPAKDKHLSLNTELRPAE